MGKKKRLKTEKQTETDKRGGLTPLSLTAIVVAGLVIAVGAGAGILVWALSGDEGGSGGAVLKPPDFAYAATAPKDSAKAYQFALDFPEYLSQVPCYCGCAKDGHKSNLDCFIKSRSGDKVEFDKHGAG